MSRNIETVRAIYAAFQKGDVAGILAHLADDVDWMNFNANQAAAEGIPWFVRRRGKAEVPAFFGGLAQLLTFDRVETGPFMESEGIVAARFSFAARYANGVRTEQDDVHWWTFRPDGKVASYRHYTDTAEAIAKWRKGTAKAA